MLMLTDGGVNRIITPKGKKENTDIINLIPMAITEKRMTPQRRKIIKIVKKRNLKKIRNCNIGNN